MSMQNVVAFQYRGGLYYRTTRLIKTDEELLVYYGDSFARELGIEPKRYFDPTLETVLEDFYCCRYCKIGLSTIKFRDNHELKCKFKKPPVNLEKWYGCKHCPCYLLSESERDLHQKRCERKREKMDDDNGSKRAKSNRKKAVREDKDQIPSKTYFCNVCDFKTRYKRSLKTHLNIHYSTRLYSCRFCDKFFKQNFHLNKHYFRRHKDHIQEVNITSKPRVCSLCGIETFDLKSHKQVHMDYNDSSYKCQICERMFKRRFDFERHLKTHTGIQTYCCISCKQKFSSKQILENHILAKHSKEMELMQSVTNKIHPCDSCSYRTSFISNLKSHIKTCKK
ncbi:zinc finger Y-chromosomal protein-like [Rhynchophorus ferrugineus]|uniref:zinc finger Y-chromosomal protein-like n=1 Tax=Rhynchophorus ferrugineus TaxID=354439 RepID=UPI003FCD19E3